MPEEERPAAPAAAGTGAVPSEPGAGGPGDDPGAAATPPAPAGGPAARAGTAGDGSFIDGLAERILGPRRYTADEVGAAVGIAVDDIDPLWMELGFAPVERDQPLFTDADVDALRLLVSARQAGLLGDDVATALARVLGQALARVSATYAQLLAPAIAALAAGSAAPGTPAAPAPAPGAPGPTGTAPPPGAPGPTFTAPARARPEDTGGAQAAGVTLSGGAVLHDLQELTDTIADVVVPTMDRFVEYSWRRHLLTALERHLKPRTSEVVGFADLVGYTRLSATLGPGELPELVTRFQELATRHLVVHGGRVVKTIGDAVLFAFPDGASAATGALALVHACEDDPALPGACAGLACGAVSEVEGDLYGDTVNRAARLVELAHPGTVLADEDTALQVVDVEGLQLRQLRPRRLKGLGYVRAWAVRSPGRLPGAP